VSRSDSRSPIRSPIRSPSPRLRPLPRTPPPPPPQQYSLEEWERENDPLWWYWQEPRTRLRREELGVHLDSPSPDPSPSPSPMAAADTPDAEMPPEPTRRVLAVVAVGNDGIWSVGCGRDHLTVPTYEIDDAEVDDIKIRVKYFRTPDGRRVCSMSTIVDTVAGDQLRMVANTDEMDGQLVFTAGKGSGKAGGKGH
jgi:hypothetical protein